MAWILDRLFDDRSAVVYSSSGLRTCSTRTGLAAKARARAWRRRPSIVGTSKTFYFPSRTPGALAHSRTHALDKSVEEKHREHPRDRLHVREGAPGAVILSRGGSAYFIDIVYPYHEPKRGRAVTLPLSCRRQAFRCFGCEAEGRLLLCKPCLETRHSVVPPYQLPDHR